MEKSSVHWLWLFLSSCLKCPQMWAACRWEGQPDFQSVIRNHLPSDVAQNARWAQESWNKEPTRKVRPSLKVWRKHMGRLLTSSAFRHVPWKKSARIPSTPFQCANRWHRSVIDIAALTESSSVTLSCRYFTHLFSTGTALTHDGSVRQVVMCI